MNEERKELRITTESPLAKYITVTIAGYELRCVKEILIDEYAFKQQLKELQ